MADQTEIVGTIVLNGIDDIIAQLQQLGLQGSAAFDALTRAAAQLSGQNVGDNIAKAGTQAATAETSIGKLGETGKAAFEGLASSAERAVGALNSLSATGALGAFEGLASTAESAASSFGSFGAVVGTVVGVIAGGAVAVGGLTLGLFEFAKSGAQATSAASGLAAAAGASLEEMEGITAAFAAAGASTENFAYQMRILGANIANTWPQIVKNVEESGDKIAENELKVADAQATVQDGQLHTQAAYIKTAEAVNAVADAQKKVAASDDAIKTAQLNLVDAQDKVRYAYLGRQQAALSVERAEYNLSQAQGAAADPEEERQLRVKEAELAVAEAKRKQADLSKEAERAAIAERAAQQALANTYDEQKKNVLALQKAQIDLELARSAQGTEESKREKEQLDLKAAQRKQAEDNLKDVKAVEAALYGTADATDAIVTKSDLAKVSTQTMLEAIIYHAGKAKAEVKGLSEAVEPGPVETIRGLSEAFKTITDNAERQALARRALGRGVGQAEINAIAQGVDVWQRYTEAEKAAGFTLDEVKAKSSAFNSALGTLTEHLDILRQQMAAPFEVIFTEEMKKLNDYIVQNRASIVQWADDMAQKVKPIIEDVFKLIEGKEIDPNSFIGKLVKGVEGFLKALGDIKDALLAIATALAPIGQLAQQFIDLTDATVGFGNAIRIITEIGFVVWALGVLGKLGELAKGFGTAEAAAKSFGEAVARKPGVAETPKAAPPEVAPQRTPPGGGQLPEGAKVTQTSPTGRYRPTAEPGVWEPVPEGASAPTEAAPFRLPRPSGPTSPVPGVEAAPSGAGALAEGILGSAVKSGVGSFIKGGIIGTIILELGKNAIDILQPKPDLTKYGYPPGYDPESIMSLGYVLRDLQKALGLGTPTTSTIPAAGAPRSTLPGAALTPPTEIERRQAELSRLQATQLARPQGVPLTVQDQAVEQRISELRQEIANLSAKLGGAADAGRPREGTGRPIDDKLLKLADSSESAAKALDALTAAADKAGIVKAGAGPGKPDVTTREPGTGPDQYILRGPSVPPIGYEEQPGKAGLQPFYGTGGVPPGATPVPVAGQAPVPVEIVPNAADIPAGDEMAGKFLPPGVTGADLGKPGVQTPVPVEIVNAPGGGGPGGGTGAPGGSEVFSPTGWTAPTGPSQVAPPESQGGDKLTEAGDKLTDAGNTLSDAGTSLTDAVSALSDAASTLGEAATALSDAASRMSTPGHAAGGLVHGPGTSSSDSVPIMASRGEYVVKADTVQKLGVHVMHAINRGTLPRFFSEGGLVDWFANIPGFAGGGAVDHFTRSFASKAGSYAPAGGSGGSRSLTLVIEGKQFPGLTGSASTMGDLERHATSSRIARIARNNPSWHK